MARTSNSSTILSQATHQMVHTIMGRNPMLDEDEEKALFLAWNERGDARARERIILAHTPLALKMARQQAGYGLDYDDVFHVAQLGLVRGFDNFDPNRGARFMTAAYWTITEEMNLYITRTISMLKGPSTGASKQLFYNLKRIKNKLGLLRLSCLEDAERVRTELAIKYPASATMDLASILEFDSYTMLNEMSLDAPVAGENGKSATLAEFIGDDSPPVDDVMNETETRTVRHRLLGQAMANALPNARMRTIFEARKLHEPPRTLDDLGHEFHISRERVRQIEQRAFELVAKYTLAMQHREQDAAKDSQKSWAERTRVVARKAERARPELEPGRRMPRRLVKRIEVTSMEGRHKPMPVIELSPAAIAGHRRSEATLRANLTRGAQRRHEISLKAAATLRARRAQALQDDQTVPVMVLKVEPDLLPVQLVPEPAVPAPTMQPNQEQPGPNHEQAAAPGWVQEDAASSTSGSAVMSSPESALPQVEVVMTPAQRRSEATRRGNEVRGADRRREISIKAAATLRARREQAKAAGLLRLHSFDDDIPHDSEAEHYMAHIDSSLVAQHMQASG